MAIGGPGGSGKSTLTQALLQRLPEAAVLQLDDYKTPRAQRSSSGLLGAHPKANRMDLIAHHLEKLAAGQGIEKPIYDPVRGEAIESEGLEPSPILLVDGEISTYPEFRPHLHLSIFVDAHWKTLLQTRITRDVEVR